MSIDIKINNRTANIQIISHEGNLMEVKVDDRIYKVDLMHTATGTFSIIEGGHSFDIELISLNHPKKYIAYTLYNNYDLEIIDAESQYLINRGNGVMENKENTIFSPMPGKIVKILFSEGDSVKEGDTAIIISAMKMESEYKSPKDGVVSRIHVCEGDTVEGNQVLIEVE